MTNSQDPVVRNVAYMVAIVWGFCRICVVMGWARPITPELAVQSISSTDALMSFVAGYLYAGSAQRRAAAGTPLPVADTTTVTASVSTTESKP